MFVSIWVILFRLLRQGNRVARESQAGKLHRTIHVTPEMITFEDAASQRRYLWGGIVGWQETRNLFVLYRSLVSFELVPKRAFPDPSLIDHFRGLLVSAVRVETSVASFLSSSTPLASTPISGCTGH
jgi:hypothetical protein